MHIIILLLFLLLIIYNVENFNNTKSVSCHIIHLDKHTNRMEHINKQLEITKFKSEIYPAVDKDIIDIDKLIQDKFICPNYYNRVKSRSVYAIFMSHYNLIGDLAKRYKNKQLDSDYSLILEDDFKIVVDDFDNKVLHILETLQNLDTDYDMIYLGNMYHNRGDPVKDNIYVVRPVLITAEAYLIKKSSLQKVYDSINIIDEAIDWKLHHLINEGKFKALVVYPTLIIQNQDELPTTQD
jgi:GR25 family glycosyltransferase involved in LPS biosynthesis